MNGNGLTGLANLGNTCFINATIQCLSHTTEFSDFLNKGEWKKKLNKKKNAPDSMLLVEWDKLRTMMWSEDCKISPGGFIQSVHRVATLKNKELFTGFAQNDLPEFLLFIIDCFHNSISREVEMNITGSVKNDKDLMAKKCYEMMQNMYRKEYSEILNMFYGISVSHLVSLNGETVGASPEPFFMIDLPIARPSGTITNEYTLDECFQEYTKNELLEGDNAWHNEKTGRKESVNKGIVFWSLPDILVIDLKRFSNDNKKNRSRVNFPMTGLDLSKYVVGYNKESYVYDLYGICNHTGNVMGGHYFAYIKTNDDVWHEFNDTEVKKTDRNFYDSAYCLFYKKTNKC